MSLLLQRARDQGRGLVHERVPVGVQVRFRLHPLRGGWMGEWRWVREGKPPFCRPTTCSLASRSVGATSTSSTSSPAPLPSHASPVPNSLSFPWPSDVATNLGVQCSPSAWWIASGACERRGRMRGSASPRASSPPNPAPNLSTRAYPRPATASTPNDPLPDPPSISLLQHILPSSPAKYSQKMDKQTDHCLHVDRALALYLAFAPPSITMGTDEPFAISHQPCCW